MDSFLEEVWNIKFLYFVGNVPLSFADVDIFVL